MHMIIKLRGKTIYTCHIALPFRHFNGIHGQHYLEFGDHLQVQWASKQAFRLAMNEPAMFVFCNDQFTDGAVYKLHPTQKRIGMMVCFEQKRVLDGEQLLRLEALLPKTHINTSASTSLIESVADNLFISLEQPSSIH